MATVSPPVFTDTVNQQFFIESQGGSMHPVNYLDRFPDTVYSKAIDSVLITFMYALMGPAGVGLLRQEYLEARLMLEEAGLHTSNLDSLYTNPFAFARLADETYELDASAALLPAGDRAQILASDAAFRNRAMDFFKGIRAGGTSLGMQLVAKSGLNHPVDIIENYRALYDQYGDRPLGLSFMGTTDNLNEVIVLPRQDIPQSSEQTFVLYGEPTSGWFTLRLPIGPDYQVIQVGMTSGSNIVTVPDSTTVPAGLYLTITGAPSTVPSIVGFTPTTYAETGTPFTPTSISLVYPPTSVNAGLPFNMTATGTFWAYVGNAETLPLPYNGTAIEVQSALQALPVIGHDNVRVTGGPLPSQPLTIQFRNQLADRPIPALQAILVPNNPSINGVSTASATAPLVPLLLDVTNSQLNIVAEVSEDMVGISADSQTTTIAPRDEHAMQVALDQIRPMTSLVTTQPGRNVTTRVPVNSVFAGQNYTEVVRYATGQAGVLWPATDQTHWIESKIEHEAPRPVGDLQHHYQGFHNIVDISSYTELALADPSYENPIGGSGVPPWVTYWDTQVGLFSPAQVALYPFLGQYQDPQAQYLPAQGVAPSPDPLIITHNLDGTGVINGIYPADYLSLPGVPPLPTKQTFWASSERAPNAAGDPCVDYLEIDLGSVQAINYVYFEATNKPYNISVEYDILDQNPARHFEPIYLLPPSVAKSTTSLAYHATVTNPWSIVEVHCANALNQMIFTRYIRIGFERTPANSPFAPLLQPLIPYSIEVRNLRIGRNLVSDLDRMITVAPASIGLAGLYPEDVLFPTTGLYPGGPPDPGHI